MAGTHPPLVVIAGPTATGKTGLAIHLAESLAGEGIGAEIISADSRQVYRGLDIGTAKATPDERRRVRHHGLDLVDPDVRFTVSDFGAHADAVLRDLAARGEVAILAGGTGLYLRAVGRGLPLDDLPWDPAVRATLEADLAADGLPALAARLATTAPRMAASVDPRNPRRVLRALEIATIAGDTPRPAPRGYPGPALWMGLALDPPTNRRWIAERARAQFAAGLVAEAVALRERWDPALPAFSAIGYAEAWAVADGSLDLEAAIERNVHRNAAFARRQRTWFRAEPGIDWLDAAGGPERRAMDLVHRFLVERLS